MYGSFMAPMFYRLALCFPRVDVSDVLEYAPHSGFEYHPI